MLLVEDNQADVYLVEMALQEQGIRCTMHNATDGEQAIHMVSELTSDQDCPGLALIDCNLPRMDGDQVVRALRSHPDCSEIPIVLMSSAESQRDRELAREFAAVFFKKPTNLTDFLQLGEVVNALLAHRA